jgi:hypothetical protein
MTIQTTKARIAEIGGQCPGIARALDFVPSNDVGEMDYPVMIVRSRSATDDNSRLGSSGATAEVLEARNYEVEVYVFPAALGVGMEAEWEEKVEPLIDVVKNYFRARRRLNGLRGIEGAYVTGDSGPKILTGLGGQDGGFTVNLTVREYLSFAYAAGN